MVGGWLEGVFHLTSDSDVLVQKSIHITKSEEIY